MNLYMLRNIVDSFLLIPCRLFSLELVEMVSPDAYPRSSLSICDSEGADSSTSDTSCIHVPERAIRDFSLFVAVFRSAGPSIVFLRAARSGVDNCY